MKSFSRLAVTGALVVAAGAAQANHKIDIAAIYNADVTVPSDCTNNEDSTSFDDGAACPLASVNVPGGTAYEAPIFSQQGLSGAMSVDFSGEGANGLVPGGTQDGVEVFLYITTGLNEDDTITVDFSVPVSAGTTPSLVDVSNSPDGADSCLEPQYLPGSSDLPNGEVVFRIVSFDQGQGGACSRNGGASVVTGDGAAAGSVVDTGARPLLLSGVQFDGADFTSSSPITMAFVTESASATLDNVGFQSIATLEDQITLPTPAVNDSFDGIIDVNNGRMVFTVEDCAADVLWCDEASASLTNDPTLVAAATTGRLVATLSGNFGFIDPTDEPSFVNATFGGVAASNIQLTGGNLVMTFNDTATSPFDDTLGVAETNALEIELTNAGMAGMRATLEEVPTFSLTFAQSFTSVYAVDGTETENVADLGSWRLNGYQAFVPYMPFQAGIGQVLVLVNNGDTAGANIFLDVVDSNGNVYTNLDLGTVGANTLLNVREATRQALSSVDPSLLTNGRVALTYTVEIPQVDGAFTASYNVNGDRNFVEVVDNSGREASASDVQDIITDALNP